MKWIKDQKVEALLRRLGVKFEAEQRYFGKIDLEEGLRRQARLVGKLNQDHVIQLALAMGQQEASFPMPVLNAPKSGRLWAWSGNHRLAAFALAFPDEAAAAGCMIDAYVTSISDPVMQDILPRVLNTVESSLGFSKEERIAHARYLRERHNIPTEEVASMFGLKPEWVSTAARAEKLRETLLPELGEKACASLSKSTLLAISPLSDDSHVLKAAARLVVDYELGVDDVKHVMADVRHQSNARQKLSELARWDKLLSDRTKPATPANRLFTTNYRQRFLDLLTRMQKLLTKASTLEQVQCTTHSDIQLVVRTWQEIEKGMRSMLNNTVERQ